MIRPPSLPMRQGRRGFTLTEVMIVVAVIAILAAVAFPSYTDYIRRGKISQATSQLAVERVRLEQLYQNTRNYGSTATACGVIPVPPSDSSFTFSCDWGAVGTNQGFLLTATGTAAAGMTGYSFTIDQNNLQQTTAFPGMSGLPVDCWVKKRGETC